MNQQVANQNTMSGIVVIVVLAIVVIAIARWFPRRKSRSITMLTTESGEKTVASAPRWKPTSWPPTGMLVTILIGSMVGMLVWVFWPEVNLYRQGVWAEGQSTLRCSSEPKTEVLDATNPTAEYYYCPGMMWDLHRGRGGILLASANRGALLRFEEGPISFFNSVDHGVTVINLKWIGGDPVPIILSYIPSR